MHSRPRVLSSMLGVSPCGWRLLGVIAAVCAVGSSAPGRQPAAVGCGIAEKQTLGAEDERSLKSFVDEQAAALMGEDHEARSKARDALMSPLACKGATFAFRSKYSELLVPALTGAARGADEPQAVNAMLLLGRLRTTVSADALAPGLKSESPVIRFATASGYRDLLIQLAKDSFGFPDAASDRVLDALAAALKVEKDPLVADMMVVALGDATRGSAALRGRAMLRLTDAAERRVLVLRSDPAAADAWSSAILRSLDLARQALFEQSGAGTIDKEFARRAAILGGQVFAYARDRVARGIKTPDMDLSRAVGAAEGLAIIAHQAAANQRRPDRGLQKAFDAAAGANDAKPFAAVAAEWIGADGILVKPPYGAKPADFAAGG